MLYSNKTLSLVLYTGMEVKVSILENDKNLQSVLPAYPV